MQCIVDKYANSTIDNSQCILLDKQGRGPSESVSEYEYAESFFVMLVALRDVHVQLMYIGSNESW